MILGLVANGDKPDNAKIYIALAIGALLALKILRD
jgi:hypothetical protein